VDKEWRRVNYNVRWTVKNLLPDRKYFYQVRTRSSDRSEIRVASNINSFKTAPLSNADQPVEFVAVGNLDPYNTEYISPEDSQRLGMKSFASMLNYHNRDPDFILLTGDTVYYDLRQWRPDVGYPIDSYELRWQVWPAQYRFENMLNFFSKVPGYWMVDDHDYWKNNYTEITEDGWYIFRNTNPTPGSYGTAGEDAESYYEQNPYSTSKGSGADFWRAIRWGQHLELFIEEGRHHRDHENDLIWGTEQRLWLQNRINESTATFKIIITTTPVIAPLLDPIIYEWADKHANGRFREETITFLNEIKDMPDVFFICGDRHWKHFSVINQSNYPEFSDFYEFSVGSGAGGTHARTPNLTENEWGTMLYYDDEPTAGYLRVQIRPQIDRVKIKFELIKVAEDIDNEVLYSANYTVPIGTEPGHDLK